MSGVILAEEAAILGSQNPQWNDIVGTVAAGEANNNPQSMPFSDNLSAATSGLASAQLFYVKNGGSPVNYTAPFAVVQGDNLYWGVNYKSSVSGSVTVSRASGPTVIDTFNVTIT